MYIYIYICIYKYMYVLYIYIHNMKSTSKALGGAESEQPAGRLFCDKQETMGSSKDKLDVN